MDIEYIRSKNFKGAVVDTNLLILLLIGYFDIEQIERNKRLKIRNKSFEKEDFYKLLLLIEATSNKIIITPNILTEVCNLTEGYNEETQLGFFKFIEETIKPFEEYIMNSNEAIQNNQVAFYKFGLTDSNIVNLSKQNYLVITIDLPLCHFLQTENLPVINYTDYRLL